MFYKGSIFPQWDGSALISGLESKAILRVTFDGKGGATVVQRWNVGKRVRDIEQAPDGSLWMLEDAPTPAASYALRRDDSFRLEQVCKRPRGPARIQEPRDPSARRWPLPRRCFGGMPAEPLRDLTPCGQPRKAARTCAQRFAVAGARRGNRCVLEPMRFGIRVRIERSVHARRRARRPRLMTSCEYASCMTMAQRPALCPRRRRSPPEKRVTARSKLPRRNERDSPCLGSRCGTA